MVSPVSEYVPVKRAVEDALSLMPKRRRVESVEPRDAFGRVSAEELMSPSDFPLRTLSRMDGFALRSADTRGATERHAVKLRIEGEVGLGEIPSARVKLGEAWRVSTGSYIPEGTDAVVPVEDVVTKGSRLTILRAVEKESSLYPAGEDIRKGSVILGSGSRFRAQDVALAVSLGIRSVKVYRRPRVAVLATGTELTDALGGEAGKTPNSHGPFFMKMAKSMGCDVVNLGIVRDRAEEILKRLRRGLKSADLLLTTGGTSVGSLDLVEDVVKRLKPRIVHHGIRMDRGRVAGVAVVKGKPVVMMPGPIQGALNAFILLATPMIRRASGGDDEPLRVRARLTRGWEARRRFPNFTKVLYLRLLPGRDGTAAEPLVGETESMSLIRRSNAVAIIPEEVTSMEAGHEIEAILLPGFSFAV